MLIHSYSHKVFGGVKGAESPASQPASHFGKFTIRLHRMIHRIFMVYEQQAIPTIATIYVCSFAYVCSRKHTERRILTVCVPVC